MEQELERLRKLSAATDVEPAEDTGCRQVVRPCEEVITTHASLPNGRQITLLKTLLSSACEKNCFYCGCRAGRDFERVIFKPEEFSDLFMRLHRGGITEGLFLSSGVLGGGVTTQDRLIDTAEILRNKLGYKGYLHLKIMPGSQKDQVLRAMQLADRISINLEAPNPSRLATLAPKKDFFNDLLTPLRYAEEIRRDLPACQGWNGRWASSTTQYVVGGSNETDLELLATTEKLIRQFSLRRAYFSAFKPVSNTPLENKSPTNPIRQDRLYQASYLLRDYCFSLEDMPFVGDGNLPLEMDPKMAWAQIHLAEHPVEINRASREELLRVPGFGPQAVRSILQARQHKLFSQLESLGKLSINSQRAAPFILLNGKHPARQLSFAF